MILTKSLFLDFLDCPGYCWLKLNDPDEATKWRAEPKADWAEQGNEVELLAQQLFPDGELVAGRDQTAAEATAKYIRKGSRVIFQATVITTTNLSAAADIMVRDGDSWTLYEVKSRVSVDLKTNIPDLAFQRAVFQAEGWRIKQVRLLHINKQYTGDGGGVDPEAFFVRGDDGDWGIDLTEAVDQYAGLGDRISRAQATLGSAEKAACGCRLKTRINHCPAFRYFWPELPEPSIYDIARLTTKKIARLVSGDILSLDQAIAAKDQIGFTDRQLAQLELHPDRERVQWARLGREFDRLDWPLYFFDYEAAAPAIPILADTQPYSQIPFLYSLLRLDGLEEEPEVVDSHLVVDRQPGLFRQLADQLASRLESAAGSVVAWHAQFERTVNQTLGRLYPELADFFQDLNQRIYDLETVFSQGFYQNGRLCGRTSVKVVTKHLVPELDYQASDLAVQVGDQASWRWLAATQPAVDDRERNRAFADLKRYCQHDTLVMVRIYQYLASGGKIRRGQLAGQRRPA